MNQDFWNNKRPIGVPDSVNLDEFSSLNDLLDTAFQQHNEKPALTCLGKTLSYGEIDQLRLKFAAWLQQESGLQPGDRIAIQLPNLLQYPVAAYGALKAGLVIVNTNPLYTLTELTHQLKDSGAKAIVCLSTNLDMVKQAAQESGVKQLIVTAPLDLITSTQSPELPDSPDFKATSFLDILNHSSADDYTPIAPQSKDDIVALQYTGGTTGVAKGAMLTQGNLVSNVLQYKAVTQERDSNGRPFLPEGEQIVIAPLPLYHIYAFVINLVIYPARGDQSILIPNPRDMDQFIASIKEVPFTMLVGINTLFGGLLAHPEFPSCNFSKLISTLSGGTALKMDVAERWQEVTGCKVIEGYGLTETSPVVSVSPIGDSARAGTVGLPLPETEIKTINAHNDECSLGEAGELCVRGPQVMAGYWQKPEATAEVIDQDGWFHTGDVAVVDSDGHIRIVDRLKDMVLVSGFNVYPNEIEDVVSHIDGVQSCAAIGVPDDKTGESVRLYIIRASEDLTTDKVLDRCRQHLTNYKIPRQVIFREALPVTAVGKVQRKVLREEALAELAEA